MCLLTGHQCVITCHISHCHNNHTHLLLSLQFVRIGAHPLCALLRSIWSPGHKVHSSYDGKHPKYMCSVVKSVCHLELAGMTKTPFPLLDPIMVGPLLLCLNIHFSLLPDLLLLSLVAVSKHNISRPSHLLFSQVYAIFDVTQTCVATFYHICCYLDLPCFTVPEAHSVSPQPTAPPSTLLTQTAENHKE